MLSLFTWLGSIVITTEVPTKCAFLIGGFVFCDVVHMSQLYKNKYSKLIFVPTHKGFYYAIAFLDLDYDELINLYAKDIEHMKEYEHFKSVPDYVGRKEFVNQTAKLIMKFKPFNKRGMFLSNNLQQLMALGFKLSLLESVKNTDFSATNYFDGVTVEQLSKICIPLEKQELIEFLKNINVNLDSIIGFFEQDHY
jgi:hypothetical protein